MADGEAGVPERVEERFDERPGLPGAYDLGIDDEDDVGVAVERDGPATEAPDGRERHAARQPGLARRSLEEKLEARVEKPRVRATEGHAVFSALEPRDEADAMPLERVAEGSRLEGGRRNAVRRAGSHVVHVHRPRECSDFEVSNALIRSGLLGNARAT